MTLHDDEHGVNSNTNSNELSIQFRSALLRERDRNSHAELHRLTVPLSWLKLPLLYRRKRRRFKLRIGGTLHDRILNTPLLIDDEQDVHRRGCGLLQLGIRLRACLIDGARLLIEIAHREEFFDIAKDPCCLENLATSKAHTAELNKHRRQLEAVLKAEADPRALGTGDIFESYPRHSPMRKELGGFAEEGQYNPAFTPNPAK